VPGSSRVSSPARIAWSNGTTRSLACTGRATISRATTARQICCSFPLGPLNPVRDRASTRIRRKPSNTIGGRDDLGVTQWPARLYMLTDSKGNRINEGRPMSCATARKPRAEGQRSSTGCTCMACHKHGVVELPKDDIRQGAGFQGAPREKIRRRLPGAQGDRTLLGRRRTRLPDRCRSYPDARICASGRTRPRTSSNFRRSSPHWPVLISKLYFPRLGNKLFRNYAKVRMPWWSEGGFWPRAGPLRTLIVTKPQTCYRGTGHAIYRIAAPGCPTVFSASRPGSIDAPPNACPCSLLGMTLRLRTPHSHRLVPRRGHHHTSFARLYPTFYRPSGVVTRPSTLCLCHRATLFDQPQTG